MEDCKGNSSYIGVGRNMDDSTEDGLDDDSKVPAKVDGSNMDDNIKQDDSNKLEQACCDIDNDAIIFGIRQTWRKKYIK